MNLRQISADYCQINSICTVCDYKKTECISCANGYNNQINNGTCTDQNCDADQILKTDNYRGYFQNYCGYTFDPQCKKIKQNVIPIACQECIPGYYIDQSQNVLTCTICPKQCSNCTSSNYNNCTDCLEGQYYDNIEKECLPCGPSCVQCNSTQCIKCKYAYSLINNICEQKCQRGQYYNSSNCYDCMENCNDCTRRDTCDLCKPGYKLFDGTCYKDCPKDTRMHSNKLECIKCTNCKECIEDTSKCKVCEDGYYLLTTNTCNLCSIAIENCKLCKDYQTCLECNQGYFLNGSKECKKKCIDNAVTNEDCSEKERCGDGKNISEECDDGNNNDGDGCSSNCKIEYGFQCSGGTPTTKDVCFKITKPDIIIDNMDLKFQIFVDKEYKKQDTHIKIDFYNRSIKQPTEKVEIEIQIKGVDTKNNKKQYDYELEFNCQLNRYDIVFKNVEFESSTTQEITVKFITKITDTNGNSLKYYEQTGVFPPTLKISQKDKEQADTAKQVGEQVVNAMLTSSILIILAGNFYLLVNIIDIAEIIYFLIFINTKQTKLNIL